MEGLWAWEPKNKRDYSVLRICEVSCPSLLYTKVHENSSFVQVENVCPLCCKAMIYFRDIFGYKYPSFGCYRKNIPCILWSQWAVYHNSYGFAHSEGDKHCSTWNRNELHPSWVLEQERKWKPLADESENVSGVSLSNPESKELNFRGDVLLQYHNES